MRENLETPPRQCPSNSNNYPLASHLLNNAHNNKAIPFQQAPLASHSICSVHNSKRAPNFSPTYLGVSCLLAYAIYQFFLGVFPSFGDFFATLLIPDFQGLPMVKSLIYHFS
jgi:hypothetical protein